MQLQFIPFKIGSLWSNTAIPTLLPLFIAEEKVFTWDVFQSSRRSCLDVFNYPKMCPLRWVLSLGNKKKSQRAKLGLYGGWGSVVILFWAKNSLTANDVWLGALSWWRNHVCAIILMGGSSVTIRWTSVFGSPTSSDINCTLKRRSLPKTAFIRATLYSILEVEGPLRAVRQRSPFRPWTPCAIWGLGLKTKQHPHKLSLTTAKFRNQISRVLRRTWSRKAAPDSFVFLTVTRYKNYNALC